MADHFTEMAHGDSVADRIAAGVFDLDACLAEVDAHLSRNGFGGDEHDLFRQAMRGYAKSAFLLGSVMSAYIHAYTSDLKDYHQEHARRAAGRSVTERCSVSFGGVCSGSSGLVFLARL